jgi:23S rRNA-intervening sequence protein
MLNGIWIKQGGYEKEKRCQYSSSNENLEKYDGLKDFQSLKAWMKCREIKLFFYQFVLQKLPKEENFFLGTQIRRTVISITSNITEGY